MKQVPIYVIGSSNTDMVVKAEKLPRAGETVIGGAFLMNPGGKGANQAVAAARLGGSVVFVAKVGNDIFGKQAIDQFRKENIDTSFVNEDKASPSGVALINVDEKGENCIVVAPGANNNLSTLEIEKALETIESPGIVLIQLEVPIEVVEYAIKRSHEKGLKIILNPAPAQRINSELLQCLHTLTPNESETELLTGIPVTDLDSAKKAAEQLFDCGVKNVVITLGPRGAYLYNEQFSQLIDAPLVTAVDTTAAGDCFNGSFAVALAAGMAIDEAVVFACKAASIAVTRMGAQSSMPYRKEVEDLKLSNMDGIVDV